MFRREEDNTRTGVGEYREEELKMDVNPADRDPYTQYQYAGGSSRSRTHFPSGSAGRTQSHKTGESAEQGT